MITNIRIELDDNQRRRIASAISGKPVKRLASRAEIKQLVMDLLVAGALSPATSPDQVSTSPDRVPEPPEARDAGVPDSYCSDDCCRQNQLLQSRVNVLQHRLDTGSRS